MVLVSLANEIGSSERLLWHVRKQSSTTVCGRIYDSSNDPHFIRCDSDNSHAALVAKAHMCYQCKRAAA